LSISQMGLASGQQTLDCIKWDSVTFINMHVLYQGGPLQVKDAYFINCCVCQLDLAHFDALIWPPASLLLLQAIPVIS
jgi:hypothetical protein